MVECEWMMNKKENSEYNTPITTTSTHQPITTTTPNQPTTTTPNQPTTTPTNQQHQPTPTHRNADVAQSKAVSPAPKTITFPLNLGNLQPLLLHMPGFEPAATLGKKSFEVQKPSDGVNPLKQSSRIGSETLKTMQEMGRIGHASQTSNRKIEKKKNWARIGLESMQHPKLYKLDKHGICTI